MPNRLVRIMNRVTAFLLVMSIVIPCLPELPLAEWLRSIAHAGEASARHAPTYAFSLPEEVLGNEMTNGEWRYALREGDGYAVVTGYAGPAEHPVLPAQLGGTDVVGVAKGAFGPDVTAVTLHGNVLSIAGGAFAAATVIHALNGSYALYWAEENSQPWVNTSAGVFTPDVVDFSDAPVSRVRRRGDTYVQLGQLEAQRVAVGSLIWMEDARGTVFFYRVTSLTDQGSSVLAGVEMPEVDDVVQELELTQEVPLTSSDFEPAQGVVPDGGLSSEERGSTDFSETIDNEVWNFSAKAKDYFMIDEEGVTDDIALTAKMTVKGSLNYTVTVQNGEMVSVWVTENTSSEIEFKFEMTYGEGDEKKFLDPEKNEADGIHVGTFVVPTGFLCLKAKVEFGFEIAGEIACYFTHVTSVTKQYDFSNDDWIVRDEFAEERVDETRSWMTSNAEVKFFVAIKAELCVFTIVKLVKVTLEGGLKFTLEGPKYSACFVISCRPYATLSLSVGIGVGTDDYELGVYHPSIDSEPILIPDNIVLFSFHVSPLEPYFHAAGDCPHGEAATVSFMTRTSDTIDPIGVAKGTPIGNFARPVPDGDDRMGDFIGWATSMYHTVSDFNFGYFDGTEVNHDMTLYAIWENMVPVTFDTQCDLSMPDVPAPVFGLVCEPPAPRRDGHSFLGWYTSPDGNGIPWNFASGTVSDSPMTLYAQWRNDITGDSTGDDVANYPFCIGDNSYRTNCWQYTREYFEYSIEKLEGENFGVILKGLSDDATHVTIPRVLTIDLIEEYSKGTPLELLQSILPDFDPLISVEAPQTLPVLGFDEAMFKGNTNLVALAFAYVGRDYNTNGMFQNCSNLEYVDMRNITIDGLYDSMFAGCISLQAAIFPQSVGSIHQYAFSGCRSLKYLTIPACVKALDYYAFNGCTGLTEIYVPDTMVHLNVTKSGSNYFGPFSYCTNVKRISVGGVEALTCGMIETDSTVLEEIVIRGTVREIGENCFYDKVSDLQSSDRSIRVIIEEGVETIGDSAFNNCHSIVSLSLPSTITAIGEYAFCNCNRLRSLTGFDRTAITAIGQSTFQSCEVLPNITIPDTVTSIASKAFWNCYAFTDVYIPDSVRHLGISMITSQQYGGPFYDCRNIRTISVGGVNTLTYAMLETSSAKLEEIIIRGTVRKIDDECFKYRCSDLQDYEISVSVIIEEGVQSIGNNAFNSCTSIVSLSLPSTITAIGEYAFAGCSRLSELNGFENTQITKIAREAFSNCRALPNVTIPNTVTAIDHYAFYGCTSFTEIFIPDSVRSISTYPYTSTKCHGAFQACTNVRKISVGGLDILKYGMLETGSKALEEFIIRGTVRNIGTGCFYDDVSDLKNISCSIRVRIEEGVQTIGSNAFNSCISIVSLSLPSTITSIGDYAFAGCSRLSELTGFENTRITKIAREAFSNCRALPNVTIPNTVTAIDHYAFYGCTSFTEIFIPDSVRSISTYPYTSTKCHGAFQSCTNVRKISVGGLDILKYGMLETGSKVLEEIIIRGTVQNIGTGCFYDDVSDLKNSSCSVLVRIEEGVQTIGSNAFNSCTSIINLSLPSTLISIGSSAFSGCSRLTSVTIPAGTAGFASNAFSKNTARTVSLTGANDEALAYFTGLGDKVVTGDLPTFAITLNAAGGTFADGAETADVTCQWLSPMPVLPVPLNGDKLFCGWYTDEDCTRAFTADTMPASDLTLYAGWDIDVYTVTLDLMGGTLDHPLTFKARAGSQPVAALVPSLTDRSFTGWYTDRYAAVPFGGTMPAADLTLYAGYIKSGLNGEYAVSGGEATLISYRLVEHESTTLYLPESVGGVPLTGIAANAFLGEDVEVLCLPASLTRIDPQALNGMDSLLRIEVRPGNSRFVAVDGVLFTADLTTLLHFPAARAVVYTVPAGTSVIGDHAFAGVPLTKVTFPEGLLRIGSSAFSDTALSSVTLPGSLTHLGAYAFSGCDSLMKFVFGSHVEEIGAGCFSGCSGLLSAFGPVYDVDGETPSVPAAYAEAAALRYNLYALTLSAASTSVWQVQSGSAPELPTSPNVGENAYFGGWWTTKDFTGEAVNGSFRMPQGNATLYAKSLPVFTFETVTAADGTATLTLTGWDPLCGSSSPEVPESIGGVPVTAIAAGCFPAEVTCVTVPACVAELADGWLCEGWSGLIIAPAGSAAALWAESNGLASSVQQHTLTFTVNGGASLASVTAESGAQLTLPVPVRTGYAFDRWYTDSALTIAAVLDENGFYAMPAADTVLWAGWTLADEAAATLTFTWEEIGGAIRVTGLAAGCTALVIPETLHGLPVTDIAARAFAYEAGLTSAVVPGSITIIPDSAFAGCSALTSVSLGEGVQTLGTDCFSLCTSLTALELPETVTTVSSGALQGTALTSLHLPASLTLIASDALRSCASLAFITVDEDSTCYKAVDGVLYDTVDDKLVRFPAAMAAEEFTVPADICVIGSYAFDGAKVKAVTLPDSVLSLENSAFEGCCLTSLPSFGSSLLTTIPGGAFAGCRSLTEAVIPETITTIGSAAFSGCICLTDAVIPASVTAIAENAFPAGITVHGVTGSAAETFAGEQGLLFVDPDVTVLPAGVTLSDGTLQLRRGDTYALTASIQPENATAASLRWRTDNASVVSVTADGVLRALAGGCAVITVTTANGLTASCTVTVDTAIPVDSIILDTVEISLLETRTQLLTARLLPENATETGLLWASGDESVCTVDETGLVTAVSAGTAFVTATTESGLTARCAVAVLPRVQTITLNCPGAFHPGDSAAVTAEIHPAGAHDPSLLWRISPAALATIDADGTITFLAPGYVTVTAVAADLGTVSAALELECLADRVYTLPAALTFIDEEAFAGAPVQCVVIPDGVTSIGANAFADCTALYKVIIPGSVTDIAPTAFSGCTLTIVSPDGSYAQQWASANGQRWRAE